MFVRQIQRDEIQGVICEKCGVEIVKSKVRREKMGHIELTTPVAHIWFLKSLPSRIAMLLDMSLKDVERVLYCECYIVMDPLDTPLRKGDLLTEEAYLQAQEEHGPHFKVSTGGEAVPDMLKDLDLDYVSRKLRKELKEATSDNQQKKIIKRLKIIETFLSSKKSSGMDDAFSFACHTSRSASIGSFRWGAFRHFRLERSLPARDQPQQPPQKTAGAQRP